jgi:hypothetical protein
MKQSIESKLLRVFVGEGDKYRGAPLYEAIVELARERHLAGATVLRGLLGFGAHSRIHAAKVLRLSDDLPIVIEIVDSTEKIEAFMEELDGMIEEGMLTTEKINVTTFRNH